MVHVTAPTSLAVDVPQGRKLFVFDRVFSETIDQSGVWDYLNESVNSFLQGYNVSILAYGQSGAGKSYTMGTSGPHEQSNIKAMGEYRALSPDILANHYEGIIPRAAQVLFEKLDGPAKHNRNASTGLRTPSRYSMSSTSSFGRQFDKNWQMKATYVEIYNEQLRDLLLPDSIPASERGPVTIREDVKGRIILTGLHQVTINSFEDLMSALNFGSSIRQTDSTTINAKSSRSHAVFSINLVQRKSSGGVTSPREKRMSMPVEALSGHDSSVTVDSKLHFVDLAGSERLKNTGASGERAKEGISINAGLASLGKVISQLSSRQGNSHISYRDSKLTRLLQDSLGGNAYTYMIACVTPAEFHLSETLNTVQYAQRARAIQSKPRIQQIADDGDKQAVIDRLKAEVAFLRQQLRNSEDGDRRNGVPAERAERQNEKEKDLQNQLLDAQESYNALSQRHAKLISGLAHESEPSHEDTDDVASTVGKNSVERLKRSHSFAESVEQVVLEYEKTIQSLESSLSNTRSSLSGTESTLLERETRCAYVETVNTQLQSRVQKLLDRENTTESYLHDLESKLDGHLSGEERHAAIVAELRKELSRARENEASGEGYISTLEERLAEADQDMELMQREMERLEHVIERQRGLGSLDYLVDHKRQNGIENGEIDSEPQYDAVPAKTGQHARMRTTSLDVLTEAAETAVPDSDEGLGEPIPESTDEAASEADSERSEAEADGADLKVLENATSRMEFERNADVDRLAPPESPAQSKFVADKLETVTQELFDMRMQHESTVGDYELLEAKYDEALKALALLRQERQDAADEVRHSASTAQTFMSPSTTNSRPISFLENAKAATDSKSGTQHSFSQSLSSELSLAGEPAALRDSSNSSDLKQESDATSQQSEGGATESHDLNAMRKLMSEHEESSKLMSEKYAQLQSEHEGTLAQVENLRTELQKSKSASPPATPTYKTPMIRRKTSQSLMSTVDRAHRSLGALRNLAIESFSDNPDTMQNFEFHLDAAMHELHNRMERIQALESETASVRKEMEMKSTIISGLTRERSSLQGGTSVDMAFVSQLRNQVVQQETQINELKEAHEAREKLLYAEIEKLTGQLKDQEEVANKAASLHAEGSGDQEKRIGTLEGELTEWKGKHQGALESLQSTEQRLTTTLAELDTALASVDSMRAERATAGDAEADKESVARELEEERAKQQSTVEGLKKDIEDHKATIATQLGSISSLEQSHASVQQQLSDHLAAKDSEAKDRADEVEGYRSRFSELEKEIDVHKSAVESHKKDLASLQESHSQELAELETRASAAAQAEYESRLSDQTADHENSMKTLRAEIAESRDELSKLLKTVSGLLSSEVTPDTLADEIQDVLSQKQHFSEKYTELMESNEELRKQIDAKGGDDGELEAMTKKSATHEAKVNELALLVATLEDTVRQKDEQVKKKETLVEEITAEKQKSVRLVEELEEQITNSFDQHHNRLSVIQQERDQALVDAKGKIATHEHDIETYRARIEQLEVSSAESCHRAATNESSIKLRTTEPPTLQSIGAAPSLPTSGRVHLRRLFPRPHLPFLFRHCLQSPRRRMAALHRRLLATLARSSSMLSNWRIRKRVSAL